MSGGVAAVLGTHDDEDVQWGSGFTLERNVRISRLTV
jgi:hypothetical protein